MRAAFEALAALLRIVERLIRARKQKQMQDKRDALEDNPAEFFNNHFDGVRNDTKSHSDKTDIDSNKQ